MQKEILKISNVSKKYRLGMIGGTTLRDELQRKRAARKGLDDPTKMIGTQQTGNVGDEFYALDGVNITIHEGERVGIIGHNGAGKSTLLKLISHITEPTVGTIEMNGRIASMLEVGTGFHPELSGRENIYMNGAILGMTKNEIDQKIEDIIDFSECRQFIDTPVKRYSSGMYVKLAFSVAAHLDSEIMIMDEVLAVGDVAFQKKCLDKMSQVSETEGRTILYVSHNMNTIRQLCERCIVLDHGKVIYDGTVDKGIEAYIGVNKMSEVDTNLESFHRRNGLSHDVDFLSISLMEREKWCITVGERIRYTLNMRVNKNVNNVGFRSRLTTADGTSVSVFLAPKLFSAKKGEEISIPLEADTSMLVPGKYSLSLALYDINEYGGWHFHDHIDNAIVFEVETKPGFNENMNWDRYYWGDVKLPELINLNELK